MTDDPKAGTRALHYVGIFVFFFGSWIYDMVHAPEAVKHYNTANHVKLSVVVGEGNYAGIRLQAGF